MDASGSGVNETKLFLKGDVSGVNLMNTQLKNFHEFTIFFKRN